MLLTAYPYPDIEMPNGQCLLWRYMDFTKFVEMLQSEALYFRRADKFEDRWEGVVPRSLLDRIEKHAQKPSWMQGTTFAEHFRNVEIPRHFLNCWHLSEIESAAMWSIYGRTHGSIAIRSTVDRFQECFTGGTLLDDSSQSIAGVWIGPVQYNDHRTWQVPEGSSGDVYTVPFFFKRPSYWYEQEFRAVIDGSDLDTRFIDGIRVKVSLAKLVEKVFVAPSSPKWLKDLVVSVLERFGFPNAAGIVQHTDLDSDAYM